MTKLCDHQHHGIDYWKKVIQSSVAPMYADQLEAVAALCLVAELTGDNCSTWHNSSKYFGTRCNCKPCADARELFERKIANG